MTRSRPAAPVLECRGVAKSFGGFAAANAIDLAVSEGEVVGVIGSNGAGKTTLLNIVSGHLKPTKGKVFFRGEDVTGVPSRTLARKGIARSFQVPQLFPTLSALENMMLALSLVAAPRKSILSRFDDADLATAARDALDHYGIADCADSLVSELPQGVRKLLDIAMATSAEPDLVLLDEPTSGVSSEEKSDVMQRLADRFAATGTTVVFIEHDMDIVRRYASRVVALTDGSVIADGPPEEVFAHATVADVIVGEPLPEGDA
ncbi:ABC transporter ATP-binding protein [Acuticoccus mangrovi]|uniref:ABC transporter ATP-binding protein n=1 Tax=Acuticoccus mangrovi TaxID=2796142 RepID=A0A934IMY6_9HYPH|nr:ABC transporter ATP-binding protein [Acuticoccus mangrovi]MBJ3774855.1 ABC transporter ATP-binding protein [Acuticoccus mangrovi]